MKEDDTVSITSIESDYSLDYEYIGPREPNHRKEDDTDSDCSELSDSPYHNGFDMWDEDPYSTNEFTWESNDMKLTHFIKIRKKNLKFWRNSSFFSNQKGWPLQLPFSCSTTNHDQSANSLSLLLSDYGVSERLHAIYRDRIIECGRPGDNVRITQDIHHKQDSNTTWLESEEKDSSLISSSESSASIFHETHASISLSQSIIHKDSSHHTTSSITTTNNNLISKCLPYTKYIKRSEIPTSKNLHTYLLLSFEPLCLEEKFGYMAIGGLEGEFEIYCCMDQQPNKIFGTKFKGKNNVLLMTNSIQIIRVPKKDQYTHLLIACMNDSGILVYELPDHSNHHTVSLLHHIRSFDRIPINDARTSPDGQHLVCVGDDACIFHFSLSYNLTNQLVFTAPQKIIIPPAVLGTKQGGFYSSQHISWSKSSVFFAHTSDTHNFVLVWRTSPKFEILYRIDAGGNTLAIQFHPKYESVLVFTNRYGYLHTVDLDQAVSKHDPTHIVSITQSTMDQAIDLIARQEVTMVSFRGEKDRRLRILAKINGIQWSKDGKHLYVSTKKRVLAYRFLKSFAKVDSLEKLTSTRVFSAIEQTKRKRRDSISSENKRLLRGWHQLSTCIRDKFTEYNSLASH